MVRAQILLTPSLYENLKLHAYNKGESISAVVREAVTKLLQPKEKNTGKILQKMAKHAGSNPNAPKDLSTNDNYLYRLP